jgi:hypothetical protein
MSRKKDLGGGNLAEELVLCALFRIKVVGNIIMLLNQQMLVN